MLTGKRRTAMLAFPVLLASCMPPGYGPYGTDPSAYQGAIPYGYGATPALADSGQPAGIVPAQATRGRGRDNSTTRWVRAGREGSLDEMLLTYLGDGRARVELSGRSGDCLADHTAVAAIADQENIQIREGSEADSATLCRIDVQLYGNTATVREDTCQPYHGARCTFDGTLRRSYGRSSRRTR